MKRTALTWSGAAAALAIIGLAAATLHARERRAPLPASSERLLYLQSGHVANRVFLSFDALAADIYWIRAIQHYGRDRRSGRTDGRFELLQPLLDLATTLDPHFNRAYRFGAIFLALEPPLGPGRPDDAIALLQKGLDQNPLRWQYAQDIGFIHYWFTRDYQEAADWFERAASMPRAPEWLRPMAAVTLAQGGDRAGARRLLNLLLESDERYIHEMGVRSLAQLDAADRIDALKGVIDETQRRLGRYPTSWNEIVAAGLLPGIPVDGTGVPFLYDPATHTATLSPESNLAPLPPAFTHP